MALEVQTSRFSSRQTVPPGGGSGPGGSVCHGSASAVELLLLHGHQIVPGVGGWISAYPLLTWTRGGLLYVEELEIRTEFLKTLIFFYSCVVAVCFNAIFILCSHASVNLYKY